MFVLLSGKSQISSESSGEGSSLKAMRDPRCYYLSMDGVEYWNNSLQGTVPCFLPFFFSNSYLNFIDNKIYFFFCNKSQSCIQITQRVLGSEIEACNKYLWAYWALVSVHNDTVQLASRPLSAVGFDKTIWEALFCSSFGVVTFHLFLSSARNCADNSWS